MISNISSTLAIDSVQQTPAVRLVPSSPSKGVTSNEDTVQLSSETQKYIANAKSSASPAAAPNITQIIKEAADGDISALAKLALIA
jgi:hypothetical protein